ncbi:MAG: pyridoxal phosphate-dependent aminotransferase, partial [Nitrospiria bacterium]
SPLALQALKENLDRVRHFPDRFCGRLREALAKHHRLGPKQFVFGNGVCELIYRIPTTFRFKKILISAPGFSEYAAAAENAGCGVYFLDLLEDSGFQLDPAGVIELIHENKENGIDAIFLCNPHNPTGRLLPKKDLLKIVAAAFHEGIFVLVDEAYIEFTETPSLIGEIPWFINLAVLRSFTPFYALPGLRLGYLAANAETITRLSRAASPWVVNTLAEIAAVASLNDTAFIAESRQVMAEGRKDLSEALSKLAGLRVFPSEANFLLLKLLDGQPDADEVAKRLRHSKILIRSCESFRGLNDRFFRIAVKSHNENAKLVSLLREILQVPSSD